MTSQAVAQLLKERRALHSTSAAQWTPQQSVCSACGEPSYKSVVCAESGLFHDLDKKRLIGGSIVEGNMVGSRQLMEAIDSTRIRWTPSRTQLVKVDTTSTNIFQTFVRTRNWNLHRYGILYGRYEGKSKTVEVHTVYEPEQHGNAFTFEAVPDARIHTVDKVAEHLGFRRVGVICTHPYREAEKAFISAREILLCAREQSRFGDECVLLTLSPTSPGGQAECQAWQASPQCVHCYRLGMLHEPEETDTLLSGDACGGPSGSFVKSTTALEVTCTQQDDAGKTRLVSKPPCHLIDTRWFTGYTSIEQFNSDVVSSLFVRISRPGEAAPTKQNLYKFLQDPKRKNERLVKQLADFHLLIFLSEELPAAEIEPLLASVRCMEMSKEIEDKFRQWLQ